MNCKYCDTPLEEDAGVCPTCGHALGPATPPEARPHLPKTKGQLVIFFGVLATVVALLSAILWQSLGGGAAEVDRQVVVVPEMEFSLTNTELGYYFWVEYFYLLDNSGQFLPASLDPALPLEQQQYDEDTTWQRHILDRALETVRGTMAVAFAAEEAGFTLDESYEQSLEAVLEKFAAAAREQNFLTEQGQPDVQAYLANSFGPGATVSSFTAYLRWSYLAAAYSDQLYLQPTFTTQQVAEYYNRMAQTYAADSPARNGQLLRTIRTVLLAPTDPADEAQWDAARESAENLLAAWRSESGTESDFSDMAVAHSAGPNAENGGLLEQVPQEQLTGQLAEWTYDEARAQGDTAVLRTDDGWVVAYYVAQTQQAAWEQQAQLDLRAETYQNTLRELVSRYEFQVDYDGISIATPGGLYSGDTQAAAGTSTKD